MPVRSPVRKPIKRRSVRRVKKQSPEMQDKEIRHHHNIIDFKIAIALALVVVSSMVITAYAKSPTSNLVASTASTVIPTTTGRLIISPKSDNTTVSKIFVPSAQPVQVAKWSVVAENEPVKLQRVRFNIVNANYTVRSNASEFGTMSLYASDEVTPLAEAVPVVGLNKGGYVEFSGLNLEVQPDQPQTLSLRSTINGSGIMKPNSMVRFGINNSSYARWQGVGVNSGAAIIREKITFEPVTFRIGAPTALNLFHNAVPVATAGSLDSTLELNAQAKIFKFTLANPGDRELRISRLMVNVLANGLNNVGSPTTTGYVRSFKLYETNSSGGLGTQLASASNCLISPTINGPKLGTATIPGVGTCSIGSLFVNFDQKNDVNSALDNYTIPVAGNRTFIVVADTTNMYNGKIMGSVTLRAQLSGSTGTFSSFNPKQSFWAGGGIFYHYAPVNGVANVQPYNQSDSYPVVGTILTLSL